MDHELVSRYISSRIWMVEDQSAKAYLSEYLLKYSIASLGNNNINNQLQVNSVNTFEKVDSQGKITQEGSILKIFFNGPMMNAPICMTGIKDISDAIINTDATAIYMDFTTGGGDAYSGYELANAINHATSLGKPVVIHSNLLGSAGILGTAPATKIYAKNDSGQFGSVGAVYNFSKKEIKAIAEEELSIYDENAPNKNKEFINLKDGDESGFRKLATEHGAKFREFITKYREYKSEDTLAGGMYFTKSAQARGFIDGQLDYAAVISKRNYFIKNRIS